MRNTTLSPFVSRHTIKEITKILLYESLRDVPLISKLLTTWRGDEKVECIDESKIMVVSVLRAALPMYDAGIQYTVTGRK
jgi:uracil phosphoribosyltransferase